MERYGRVVHLLPDKLEEYKQLHVSVWPSVLQTIRACNIRNYSIFYRDGYLFSYFEHAGADFQADMAKMLEDKPTRQFGALCEPMQKPLATAAKGELWTFMEEVFHCES
jgi:L-rhamnose mutarotase